MANRIVESDLIGVGEPWTRVHKRVWEVPGAIVDLGCLGWDWSGRFFGKKHVIGVDPLEAPISQDGVDLFRGVVTCVRGQVLMSTDGCASTTRGNAKQKIVESITLSDLLEKFAVNDIAALKLNVEGSEYELLISMPEKLFARIDQIAVSFHDFVGLGSYKATSAVISYLSHWYDVISIDGRWSWYLCVHKT